MSVHYEEASHLLQFAGARWQVAGSRWQVVGGMHTAHSPPRGSATGMATGN